jgi:hypothetical protein
LTAEEFKKLREYPLCPSRKDGNRMVVSQLYEPSVEVEKLDLPIISWPVEVYPTIHSNRPGDRHPQKQDSSSLSA